VRVVGSSKAFSGASKSHFEIYLDKLTSTNERRHSEHTPAGGNSRVITEELESSQEERKFEINIMESPPHLQNYNENNEVARKQTDGKIDTDFVKLSLIILFIYDISNI
jgi:hypothetical protein